MDTPKSDSVRNSLKPGAEPAVHYETALGGVEVSDLGPPQYDAAATRRLLRKLDIRLLPFFALLYL